MEEGSGVGPTTRRRSPERFGTRSRTGARRRPAREPTPRSALRAGVTRGKTVVAVLLEGHRPFCRPTRWWAEASRRARRRRPRRAGGDRGDRNASQFVGRVCCRSSTTPTEAWRPCARTRPSTTPRVDPTGAARTSGWAATRVTPRGGTRRWGPSAQDRASEALIVPRDPSARGRARRSPVTPSPAFVLASSLERTSSRDRRQPIRRRDGRADKDEHGPLCAEASPRANASYEVQAGELATASQRRGE